MSRDDQIIEIDLDLLTKFFTMLVNRGRVGMRWHGLNDIGALTRFAEDHPDVQTLLESKKG
jgi:hypothetical protein